MPARLVGVLLGVAVVANAPGPAVADVFFGDTHAHSGLSNDATGSPDGFFTVARDLAGLDFVVLVADLRGSSTPASGRRTASARGAARCG